MDTNTQRAEISSITLAHLLDRLEHAEVEEKPFPHFFVTNLLPSKIYEQLLDSFPEVSYYEHYTKYDQDGAGTRYRMMMTDKNMSGLPPETNSLWLGVRDALGDPQVKRSIFRQLKSGIAYRFGISPDEAEDVPAYPNPALMRETTGYAIKPHPDTRKKVITMQIAMPQDETQQHLGMGLYRLSASPPSLLKKPKGFKRVKQFSFLPNSANAFVVLNTLKKRSWHGREELPPDAGVRNTLLHIYYGEREHANDDLVSKFYAKAA